MPLWSCRTKCLIASPLCPGLGCPGGTLKVWTTAPSDQRRVPAQKSLTHLEIVWWLEDLVYQIHNFSERAACNSISYCQDFQRSMVVWRSLQLRLNLAVSGESTAAFPGERPRSLNLRRPSRLGLGQAASPPSESEIFSAAKVPRKPPGPLWNQMLQSHVLITILVFFLFLFPASLFGWVLLLDNYDFHIYIFFSSLAALFLGSYLRLLLFL